MYTTLAHSITDYFYAFDEWIYIPGKFPVKIDGVCVHGPKMTHIFQLKKRLIVLIRHNKGVRLLFWIFSYLERLMKLTYVS